MTDQLPLAANYSEHQSLAVVMPTTGAIVTIYEPNSKGGVLVPIHDDVQKYNGDIGLIVNVLNRMKNDNINMNNVKITILSDAPSFANQVKNSLPGENPDIIDNKYGQVLRFDLNDGSHRFEQQINQPPMSQKPKTNQQVIEPPNEQYTSPFQYH